MSHYKAAKRIRSCNYSEPEKLLFIKLLQAKGSVIITKAKLTDAKSNKQKEDAWELISKHLSATGKNPRAPKSLKKLWTKLKMDAKAYKNASQDISMGVGEPAVKHDPILEQVLAMTDDGNCTYDYSFSTDDDGSKDVTPSSEGNGSGGVTVRSLNNMEFDVVVNDHSDSNDESNKDNISVNGDNNSDEETEKTSFNHTNRIKTTINYKKLLKAKLETQSEKKYLVLLKKVHEEQLHHMKVESERLKQSVLKELLKKLQGSEELNPTIVNLVMNATSSNK